MNCLFVRANPFHLETVAKYWPHLDNCAFIVQSRHVRAIKGRVNFTIIDEIEHFYDDLECYPAASSSTRRAVGQIFAEALLMFDRWNRWGASCMSISHHIWRVAAKCEHILDSRGIDRIIFHDVPHAGFDLILWALAAERQLQVSLVIGTHMRDRVHVTDDWRKAPGSPQVIPPSDISIETLLSGYMTAGTERERSVEDQTSRAVSTSMIPRTSLRNLRTRIKRSVDRFPVAVPERSMHGLERAYHRRSAYGDVRRGLRLYESRCNNMPSTPFVLFPMQLQPEATTLPRAGAFVDQIEFARTLVGGLPAGVRLVVKEHPAVMRYWSHLPRARSTAFYDELTSITDVSCVSLSADMSDLIRRSVAVATLTGTVGIEAIRAERPVLAGGWPWYLGAPGVHTIRSSADVMEALASTSINLDRSVVDDWLAFAHSDLLVPGRSGRDESSSGFTERDMKRYVEEVRTCGQEH